MTYPIKVIDIEDIQIDMFFTHQNGSILKVIGLNMDFDGNTRDKMCRVKFLKPYDNNKEVGNYSTKRYYHCDSNIIANNILDLSKEELSIILEKYLEQSVIEEL